MKGTEEIENIKKQLDELKRIIMEKDDEIDTTNKTLKKRVDDIEKTNEAMEKQLEEIKAEHENENESDMEENKYEKCEFIARNKAGLKSYNQS